MPTTYTDLTPGSDARAALVTRYRGQPGPTGEGREEYAAYQWDAGLRAYVLRIETTRPATIADLLDSDRPVLSVTEQGDYVRAVLPASEYAGTGVLGCLRRRQADLSDEDRAARSERAKANLRPRAA